MAVVDWFESPTQGLDWNGDIACPCIYKRRKSDLDGNFWDLRGLQATKVILALHLSRPDMWQVLHVDSDFVEKEYC